MRLVLSLVAALAVSGCVLHLGDDTECVTDDSPPPPAATLLVNPATLQCEAFDAPGSPCGGGSGFDPNVPTWGDCQSTCRSLGEGQCMATPGCRGAYDHDCLFGTGPCPAVTPFLGCFPTDRNQDFITGCAGLDAWHCSRHEQCIATHRMGAGGLGFVRCLPEETVGNPF